ncbi:MAG: hypothetical protein OXF08_10675, partial [Bacteroidetes bacterium]|nr:hypothetical protein [Bacteroidota bacterium]
CPISHVWNQKFQQDLKQPPSILHACHKINTPANIAQCICRTLAELLAAFPYETKDRLPNYQF